MLASLKCRSKQSNQQWTNYNVHLNISDSIFIAAVWICTSLDWRQAEKALTQGYLMFGLDTQLLVLETRYTKISSLNDLALEIIYSFNYL